MPELDQIKRAINESSELSRLGHSREALELLDDLIADAIREERSRSVRILSRHAAVISDSIGDLDLVKRYCEQALAHAPDDPATLYGLANILFHRGETEAARQYAAKSYQLCVGRDSEEHSALLELIVKRWPEIGSGGQR